MLIWDLEKEEKVDVREESLIYLPDEELVGNPECVVTKIGAKRKL